MSNNNYYSKKYIPSITKWGKGTLLLGIVLCFAPLIVVSDIWIYASNSSYNSWNYFTNKC